MSDADKNVIRAYMDAVSDELPEGWGMVIVVAQVGVPGGVVMSGGARLSRETSVELLREVFEQLEAGAGAFS